MEMIRRPPFAMLAVLLAGLHAAVIFAGFVAPYDAAAQNRDVPFAPPTRLHFVDPAGHFRLRPFVYSWKVSEKTFGKYQEDRAQAYQVHFFVRGDRYRVAGVVANEIHLFGVDAPAHMFVLGTDAFGRDVFSRTLYGGQISLLTGLLATSVTLTLGLLIGGLAGFYGGWVDDALMRVADLFLALPWLYLLFAVRAFLPLQMEPLQAFLVVVFVIGFVGWARPARLIRGIFLTAKERNYVHAARGFGAGDGYIVWRHILPAASGVILTQAALLLPQYVMAEITLSFLGLGVGEPVPTWGNMLNALLQMNILQSYWWMIAPGLVTIPFFLGYQVLGGMLGRHIARAEQ
jgi:peptide/nickel transport system permease protein